jgi:hypothetical protein
LRILVNPVRNGAGQRKTAFVYLLVRSHVNPLEPSPVCIDCHASSVQPDTMHPGWNYAKLWRRGPLWPCSSRRNSATRSILPRAAVEVVGRCVTWRPAGPRCPG